MATTNLDARSSFWTRTLFSWAPKAADAPKPESERRRRNVRGRQRSLKKSTVERRLLRLLSQESTRAGVAPRTGPRGTGKNHRRVSHAIIYRPENPCKHRGPRHPGTLSGSWVSCGNRPPPRKAPLPINHAQINLELVDALFSNET